MISVERVGLFDFMWRRKDRVPPDKSNAFWLEHLSDFDRRCSHLTITVPREQNEQICVCITVKAFLV